MTPQTQIEKRRFFRHPVSVPIQYQAISAKSSDKSASVDVSEGGMCFFSSQYLPVGTKLSLSIPVGHQLFKVKGQVAYCASSGGEYRFRTGVAFLDPASAFRAKLAEEILQISEYQKKISREEGREIGEEEAAREWIRRYAKDFSHLF